MITCTIEDKEAFDFRLDVPNKGVWFAHLHVEDLEATFSGSVTIKIADLTLKGFVIRDHLDKSLRSIDVAGGKAGWRKVLKSKGYTNDGGVEAKLIVEDLASETDETLDKFAVNTEKIGKHYVRVSRIASDTLVEAIGLDSHWWVDWDGKTQVAKKRETKTLKEPSDYTLLAYEPKDQYVKVSVESLKTINVGYSLSNDLFDSDKTVDRFVVSVSTMQELIIECWCSDHNSFASQLEAAITRVAERQANQLLEYKVVAQNGNRLDLDPIDADNHPQITKVEIWYGIPGIEHKELVGMHVLVSFIDGKRARPVVVAFAPPSGDDWIPPEIKQTTRDKYTLETTDAELNPSSSLTVNTVDTENNSTSSYTVNTNEAEFSCTESFKVNIGAPKIEASATGVDLCGGFDKVALDQLVQAQFMILKTVLITAFASVGAGLAANGALGAAQMASYVPSTCGATQVKAT